MCQHAKIFPNRMTAMMLRSGCLAELGTGLALQAGASSALQLEDVGTLLRSAMVILIMVGRYQVNGPEQTYPIQRPMKVIKRALLNSGEYSGDFTCRTTLRVWSNHRDGDAGSLNG